MPAGLYTLICEKGGEVLNKQMEREPIFNSRKDPFSLIKDDTFPDFSEFPDFRTYFLDFPIFMNLSDLQKGLK